MPQFDLYCFGTVALTVILGFFLMLIIFTTNCLPQIITILKFRAKIQNRLEELKKASKNPTTLSTRARILILLKNLWK